jgi:hypothetical protein
MKYFLEKHYKIIISAILLFMAVVSILNAKNDSMIYDEDAHIPAGYSYLTQHDIRLNPEHPPLIKELAAIPLLFLDLKFDTNQSFWNSDPNTAQWGAGSYFLFTSGNDADKIIFLSRLPIILLSLIFGLFIFKWTRELGGIVAGLFALTLYAFDPNILGHNHFVTTDLSIAAFIAFAFYYFLKFIKNPTWKNVLIAGLFLGLMQLAKFSSILTLPVLGLITVIYPLIKLHPEKNISKLKTLGEYLGKGAIIFFSSILIVWIGYSLNTYKMPPDKIPEIMSYYLRPDDPRPQTIYARKVVLSINSVPLFRPLADYTFGVIRIFQRVGGGNTTYFMQEVNKLGFLSYFPIVFLIKEPLPLLFLLFFSLGIGIFKIVKSILASREKESSSPFQKFIRYLRTNITEFSMLLFIFIYALTSISGKLNIGFRHLFPILPFMYILVAKNITFFVKKSKEKRPLFFTITFALIVFMIFETIFYYPYYLSYFNQTVGGPKNGYTVVADSNADWGQDLKRLKTFLTQHPEITKIKLDYFGGGYFTHQEDVKYYLGDNYTPWGGDKRPLKSGWYAISTNYLQNSIYDKNNADNQSYRWLKNKKPAYQVGTSILIYYISDQEAQALNAPSF